MSRAATVEEDAARWLMRREDAAWSAADERALAAWLGASSAHQAAFWRLEAGWAAADRVAALGTVVPQATTRRRWPLRVALPRLRPAGRWVPAAVAASLLLAIGGTAWRQGMLSPPAEPAIAYHTPVGGYRVVALDDGSRVEMNTATRLRAAPRGGTREVWLDSGEAFFDIAHRDDRRFVVHAGPRTVTVLGTRFSVRRDGDRVTVAVVSGRVRIDDARGSRARMPRWWARATWRSPGPGKRWSRWRPAGSRRARRGVTGCSCSTRAALPTRSANSTAMNACRCVSAMPNSAACRSAARSRSAAAPRSSICCAAPMA
ncbi:FecR family protein [Sphingomonas hankookensis]|uniref:FecR family protein n=1 Tax=Sphingomonas hankookensis TaxID=563996 RepID=UPI003D303096